ncbi:unnamed protein product [Vicia faba]|uniref:Reverse transcriptase domain-containing protein n=1 Tax=Vicia faba TaxID=3906 RepID=A0AAV0ZS70_VICFA|nr:unnamed protein product [Vicia faba]
MDGVSAVSYRFNINGDHSKLMMAKRDDILLFARGDKGSVDLMMQTIQTFSNSTGLVVDPSKCNVYFGVVEDDAKQLTLSSTGFNEGKFPFRKSILLAEPSFGLVEPPPEEKSSSLEEDL